MIVSYDSVLIIDSDYCNAKLDHYSKWNLDIYYISFDFKEISSPENQ